MPVKSGLGNLLQRKENVKCYNLRIKKEGFMQYSTKVITADKKSYSLWVPISVAAASIGLALVGIFVLAEWAEVSPVHHAVQHVLIFLAGTGFGGSSLYLSRKGTNHES
jgi:hypothetical protein